MSKPYKGDRKQGHSAILRNTSVSDPQRDELRTGTWINAAGRIEQLRDNGAVVNIGGNHIFVSLHDIWNPEAGERAAASPSHDDTKILDWLIFYAGRIVVHDSAETVTVQWYDSDGDSRETPILDCSPREAVQKAMEINAKL